jgi:diaminopimelate epimerase
VAHRLGLCGREVTVEMPGGTIAIEIGEGNAIQMTGSVTRVGEGVLNGELWEDPLPGKAAASSGGR